jgi:hypothetical protein
MKSLENEVLRIQCSEREHAAIEAVLRELKAERLRSAELRRYLDRRDRMIEKLAVLLRRSLARIEFLLEEI